MEFAVGASEATLKSLVSKLGALLAKEYGQIRGVRGDIQFITDELASMQAFLSNLRKQEEDPDDLTEGWMKQVRDVAYDIEDSIDDIDLQLGADPAGDGCLAAARRTLHEARTCWPRRDVAAKIAELKERAQFVGDRRTRYGVPDPRPGRKKSNLGGATGYLAAEHQGVTRRLVGVKQPVGVKEMPHLEAWIADDSRRQVGVLSIVGFGGVGKTTVGLALYRKLGPRFDRRAMVTVSQSSDTEVVLRNILSQVKPLASSGERQGEGSSGAGSSKIPVVGSILSQMRRLPLPCLHQKEDGRPGQEKLRQIKSELETYLKTTRYLLLIDDVWSSSTWQNIKKYLPENNECSRIIVTTRIPAVAATCSARKDHDLVQKVEVLCSKEAANLFQKTLEEWSSSGDSQSSVQKFPDRVWEMCGGLPLAIVTMAGLVASNPQIEGDDWIEVCNSLFPDSKQCHKPEEFMKIINHCYNDLDSDLKTCSLYLSIFPKGSKISRKRLMRRWIAEGFVSEKQGLSVEDVAEAYFNQLIKRNIVRPVEHSSNGRVKNCQVHDMVLEYIISKAAEEDFICVIGSHWSMPIRSNKVRRLSIHSSDPKRASSVDSMNLSHVRSLTVFGGLDKLQFKSFKTRIVQVLDLEGCRGFKDNRVKVSHVCEMVLLKYLSLRRTDINNLPQDIGKLKYLETLDIRETEIRVLPKTVGLLERINNILGGDKRTRKTLKLPEELKGTMRALHILSGIEIVEGSAASDLGFFTGLRKLAIYKIQNSEEIFKDLLSSIQYLSGYALQTLVINDESSEFLKTLDSMQSYPTDLKALELSGKLLKLPKWLKHLEGLVKLTLSATTLGTDNLQLLSTLSSLFSLTFSINDKQDPAMAAILEKNKSDSGGEIFIPAGGFSGLKLLRIFVPLLPSVNFAKKATQQLERIELRFKSLEGLHGMAELEELRDAIVTVHAKADNHTMSILNDLKVAANCTLIINEYHG